MSTVKKIIYTEIIRTKINPIRFLFDSPIFQSRYTACRCRAGLTTRKERGTRNRGGELAAELARKWVGGNDQLGIAELKIYWERCRRTLARIAQAPGRSGTYSSAH